MVMQYDDIEYNEAKERALNALKRGSLFERALQIYGYKCHYCPSLAAGVDHLIPLSRTMPGLVGRNGLANVRPSCQLCNQIKGVMTDEEYFRALTIVQKDFVKAVRLTVRHFKDIPEVYEIRRRAILDMERIRAKKKGFEDQHLYYKSNTLGA